MKISLILLALVAGIAANVAGPDSAVMGLDELDQELEDFILEEDDEEEDDFDEDEDEEQSSIVRSIPFLEGRNGVCAGKAKGGCTKAGGECVTEPFADNCKAIYGDVGKLKKNACKSKDCQCCAPPPTCSGKIKKSCSKNGGYCVLKPFKSNCRGGTLNKKACKSKFCQCCTPGTTGGNKETTPIKPATTVAAPTSPEKTTVPPKTTLPPPTTARPTTIPPPAQTTPPPPTTILPTHPPTTLPPAPQTTTPPPQPTTVAAPPPTTTPSPQPTTLPPAPPTTAPAPPPTTLPPAPQTTIPQPQPTTLPPTTTLPPPPPTTTPAPQPTTLPPKTTTPPPPPTTLPPAPTTQAVPENRLLPTIRIRDEHVKWTQGFFSSKTQDYTLVLARGPGLQEEFVYIQHSYPQHGLINVCDLQYGVYESNGRKGVFFVYHDKSQTPYQKRFGLNANGIDQELLDAIDEDINSGTFPGTSTSSSFWSFSWVWGDSLKDVDC